MAARRGYRWLGEVANHIGIVLLLLGLVLGVTVTASILVFLGWKWAVVAVLGLVALVVFEGTYRVWDESDRAGSTRYSEVRYSLHFQALDIENDPDPQADMRSYKLGLRFRNGGEQVIKYRVVEIGALFDGEIGTAFNNLGAFLYPGQETTFYLPTLRMKADAAVNGEVSYAALYGHPDDVLRYRTTRTLRVEQRGVRPVVYDGHEAMKIEYRWFNIAETDSIDDDSIPN